MYTEHFVLNLVPRVFRLFGQWLVARRDSGELEFYLNLIGCSVTTYIVLPQKSPQRSLGSLLATNRWPKILRTLGTRLFCTSQEIRGKGVGFGNQTFYISSLN